MINKIVFIATMITLFLSLSIYCQPKRLPHNELENPAIQSINKETPHSTFFSYSNRSDAITDIKENSDNFIPLNGIWDFNFALGFQNRKGDYFENNLNLSQWKKVMAFRFT